MRRMFSDHTVGHSGYPSTVPGSTASCRQEFVVLDAVARDIRAEGGEDRGEYEPRGGAKVRAGHRTLSFGQSVAG